MMNLVDELEKYFKECKKNGVSKEFLKMTMESIIKSTLKKVYHNVN